MKKVRLDQLVFDQGLSESRERAKAIIMSGVVYVNGQRADKPGAQVAPDVNIEVRGNTLPYVSRGGLKLEKAIAAFGLTFEGKTCMDVGSSTGGFTDCMLQKGAQKVYAVDVGYGLLDWKLRNGPRVVVMERTNARLLNPEMTGGERMDFASMDVSFISIRTVLPAVRTCMKENAHLAVLVKPQFEARREQVGKGGIVRDPKVHREVLETVIAAMPAIGLMPQGLTISPIKGVGGNTEFLLHLTNTELNDAAFQAERAIEDVLRFV